MQERRNSSALGIELRFSCTNPSIYIQSIMDVKYRWQQEVKYHVHVHIVYSIIHVVGFVVVLILKHWANYEIHLHNNTEQVVFCSIFQPLIARLHGNMLLWLYGWYEFILMTSTCLVYYMAGSALVSYLKPPVQLRSMSNKVISMA